MTVISSVFDFISYFCYITSAKKGIPIQLGNLLWLLILFKFNKSEVNSIYK